MWIIKPMATVFLFIYNNIHDINVMTRFLFHLFIVDVRLISEYIVTAKGSRVLYIGILSAISV